MAEDTMKIDGLKKAVKTDKLVLGARRSVVQLKGGKVATIYTTVNTAQLVREDIEHYAKLAGTEVVHLDVPSDELGIICKRQHTVSVASVLK